MNENNNDTSYSHPTTTHNNTHNTHNNTHNNNSNNNKNVSKKRSYEKLNDEDDNDDDDEDNNNNTNNTNTRNKNNRMSANNNNNNNNNNNKKGDDSTTTDDKDNEKYIVSINEETGKVIIKERPTQKMHTSTNTNTNDIIHDNTNNTDEKSLKNNQHALSLSSETYHTNMSYKNKQKFERLQMNKKQKIIKNPGEEYRSKKAGGDVWKKGMLQPHAYIPLDPKLLSKKNHNMAISQFATVVQNKNNFQNNKNANNNNTSINKKKLKLKRGQGNRNQRRSSKAHTNTSSSS